MLDFDGSLNAFSTEYVLAGCDNGVVKVVKTDRAFVTAVNAELKKQLESELGFFIEDHDIVLFNKGKKVSHTGAGQLPMTAYLTEPKEDFEDLTVACETLPCLSIVVALNHSFGFGTIDR